jgi:flagellar motility protein MotE (MotC chaperone)
VINERAYAAQDAGEAQDADEPGQTPEDAGADEDAADEALPPADPREAARRELPTASRLGIERGLAERRRELDLREEALDTREQLIVVAERRVDDRITQLRTLRDEIQVLLGELDENRESQISSIVATYSQLEPDAAAGILVQMDATDPETLLLVAERLNSDTYRRRFAAIMAELPPQVAASLTTRLRARAEAAEARVQAEARLAEAQR